MPMLTGAAVRCPFCPGATPGQIRVARGMCQPCRDRERDNPATCPWCHGVVLLDPHAQTSDGPAAVAFCTACEFCVEVTRL